MAHYNSRTRAGITHQFRWIVLIFSLIMMPALDGHANEPAPDKATSKFEIRYMQFTIDHHGMGVEMSQLCLQRAITGELLDLCQRNLTGQSQELMLLQSFLSSWYGINYAPEMKPSGERTC